MPYVKREEPFRCPTHEGAPASYSFNPRLQGLTVARLQRPAATVVFYEGTGGKLDFRHDGLADVVSADGEFHSLAGAQPASLRWLP